MCCLCMVGRNPTFVASSEKQQAGLGVLGSRVGVLGRGRGGVQVLEHLGPESAEHLYSPARPQQCREYRSCAVSVWWEGTLHSLLLRRSSKQGWGCWAAGLGVLGRGRGGVQVLEHLGPESAEHLYSPARPQQCREYRSCAVSVWWEGTLHSLLLRRSSKQGWGCWAAGLGVLGRGRGGVQVLEHLGPESAEHLYSPARPRQCRGIQIMCCLCMVGTISKVGSAGPEYRFWNICGRKVPKTCTRPRAPGNAGEYRTCGGDGSVHGAVPSGLAVRCNGSVRFMAVRFLRFGSGSRTFLILVFRHFPCASEDFSCCGSCGLRVRPSSSLLRAG